MYMVDLKNNKGFTLVDVIIAGAMIAILIVMTFPLMSDFLMLKNEKEEEEVQEEILRTLHVMAEQEFRIPVTDSIVDFASETQLYGNYLSDDIIEDPFRQNRHYRGVVGQEVFRDATFDVHYAVLYSTGTDGCWGEGLSCVSSTISTNITGMLGTNPANFDTQFRNIEAPEGDFLIKFTDRDYQMARYEKTSKRLERLIEALTEYGELKRYEGIADGISPTAIFFPPSEGPISDTLMAGLSPNATDIQAELDDLIGVGVTDIIYNEDSSVNDKEERRLSMIALVRTLGLPDEYCCNAMRTFIDGGGDTQEEAFFYYSNPLARIDPFIPTCGPAASTIADRKLPPRITVDEDPCGK
jgi:type II secretory pathway pseudopilin PulG